MGDWDREFGAGVFAEDVVDRINRTERIDSRRVSTAGGGSARSLTARSVRDDGGSFHLNCTCGWRARVDLEAAPDDLEAAPDDLADVFIPAVHARGRWLCPKCGRRPDAVVKDRNSYRLWTCSGSTTSEPQELGRAHEEANAETDGTPHYSNRAGVTINAP